MDGMQNIGNHYGNYLEDTLLYNLKEQKKYSQPHKTGTWSMTGCIEDRAFGRAGRIGPGDSIHY